MRTANNSWIRSEPVHGLHPHASLISTIIIIIVKWCDNFTKHLILITLKRCNTMPCKIDGIIAEWTFFLQPNKHKSWSRLRSSTWKCPILQSFCINAITKRRNKWKEIEKEKLKHSFIYVSIQLTFPFTSILFSFFNLYNVQFTFIHYFLIIRLLLLEMTASNLNIFGTFYCSQDLSTPENKMIVKRNRKKYI